MAEVAVPISTQTNGAASVANVANVANMANGSVEHHGTNGKRPHVDSSPTGSPRKPQPQNGGGGIKQKPPKKKFRGRKPKAVTDGSAEEVLFADIRDLQAKLEQERETTGEETETETTEIPEEELPEQGTEVEMDVVELSSTGEALAVQHITDVDDAAKRKRQRRRVYVLSFAVPGDVVRAKVYRHNRPNDKDVVGGYRPLFSVADFIRVTEPSASLRDDGSRIQCQYFGRCSGCQYQMLDYSEQLRIKRRVVERAYRHFSQLAPEQIPTVLDTVASPLQYGYRTKLTPHFDGPPGFRRKNKAGHTLTEVPDIGFMQRGGGPRTTLDIEQCPIGTAAVAKGMARERGRVAKEFASYQRGATILLRENTQRYKKGDQEIPETMPEDSVVVETTTPTTTYVDVKTCITDNNATSTEYVDDYVFTNPAGSFFQNNNSILPVLTQYVRSNVRRPEDANIRYLIDAYSGSGLFTITLASTLPGGSIGIDIADQSIAYARRNAQLNHLSDERCRFLAADATELFSQVSHYRPDETAVVLDPPRKGCDAPFLRQLLAFAPARIVYVSCNVHTQARDVGMLVRGHVDAFGKNGSTTADEGLSSSSAAPKTRYAIESLRGFDFFPQTAHVEGIAVLNRVD